MAQRQLGFNKSTIRSANDYYVTPPRAVEALLRCERFVGVGWEPACGNGAIARYFPGIIASDLRTDSDVFGERGVDFLRTGKSVDYVITNPPFCRSVEFAEHALECASKVALLNRLLFLEGIRRYWFFLRNPPVRIHVFSDRIKCNAPGYEKDVGGLMCFAWFVWERGFSGLPTVDWILADQSKLRRFTDKRGRVRGPLILLLVAAGILAVAKKFQRREGTRR